MQSKKPPKDDKDPPKDDKDKTSSVRPPTGEGGEGSIPGKPVSKSSFMSNDEETVWNNAEDSTYKRIHKRFVPMVAIAWKGNHRKTASDVFICNECTTHRHRFVNDMIDIS